MTYSLNYGDLLKRQAELQILGGMPTPTLEQVRVALLTEIGELAQELKPDWAWWTKPGAKKEVDREKALGEAADVLHFVLLMAIVQTPDDYIRRQRGELCCSGRGSLHPALELSLIAGSASAEYVSVAYAGCNLCDILARYGFTPDDLARAYFLKTDENLRRWAAVEGQ